MLSRLGCCLIACNNPHEAGSSVQIVYRVPVFCFDVAQSSLAFTIHFERDLHYVN